MKIRVRNKKLLLAVFAVTIAFTMVASAGLLTLYGTVKTTATVSQSVVLWDGSAWKEDNTAVTNTFPESGEELFGGCCECFSHSILNRGCVEAPITMTTDIDGHGKGPGGVDVEYIVGYWNVAGHTFPSLDDYDCDLEVPTGYSDIQYVFNNNAAEEGDVICVQSGTYNGFTVDVDGVTIVSNGATVEGEIKINADDVTIEGFIIMPTASGNDNGIDTQNADNFAIRNNQIKGWNYIGTGSEPDGTGLYVDKSNGIIEYNTIEGCLAGIGGTENFEGDIEYNVIKDNDEGIGVGNNLFTTYGNIFENNVADFRVYVNNLDPIDGKPNYYGCDGPVIDYKETSGSWVNADYGYLGDSFTLEPGQQIDFVIKYCFDIAIKPGDYTITTEFSPATS